MEGAYGVGDNAVLAFDFVRPVDLKTINFYSWWSDTGRNGMGIAGLYVRRAGKTDDSDYLLNWQTWEEIEFFRRKAAKKGFKLIVR